jgi:hypothetical protein
MKARNPVLAVSSILLCLLGGRALAAEVTFSAQFLTRQPAPGTAVNVNFTAFGSPVVGGVNQTAFPATIEGPGVGSANDQGIWNRSNAIAVLVEREGFAASGFGGGVMNNGFTNDSIVLNSSNQIAFQASLIGVGVGSQNNEGIWHGAPGALVLVTRKGFQAAGLSAGANYDGFLPPAVNNAGQVAFKALLTGLGVGNINNEGIWSGAPAALTPVARKGSSAAGLPASVFYDALSAPVLNDNGQVAFKGLLNGAVGTFNNEALWTGAPGALALVARKGTQAAGLGASVNYDGFVTDPPAYNRSNQVAFVAALTGLGVGTNNNEGLWFGAPGALTLIARMGSTAAGLAAGVNYNGFNRPVINGSGRIAFKGLLIGTGVGAQNDQAIWTGPAGTLSVIARSGSNAPGASAGAIFSGFSDPIINETGLTVFKATLTGLGIGPQNNEGIWTADAGGNVRLVLQKASFFNVGGGDMRMINSLTNDLYSGNGEDGRPRSLNEAGQLALHLGFIGSTNAIVVAQLGSPALLTISATNNSVQLSWTGNGFLLESATAVIGPWLTFTNQANPQSVLIEAGERFFRLRLP